ncbi:hypothetical protein [Methylobrevis pamukkalensis]|uniref:Uncharacterized protein n=1 Tax=Methylobrevis pamukkalensis TaxID=1439726 RepID=A0A1E3GPJ1_9HYPH|nr:hypothetical protein [Methylobrevis pamukkalensis]ODN65496.1 hypothetical protein A6302_04527 [Methylobrevis pamukkalensis]
MVYRYEIDGHVILTIAPQDEAELRADIEARRAATERARAEVAAMTPEEKASLVRTADYFVRQGR